MTNSRPSTVPGCPAHPRTRGTRPPPPRSPPSSRCAPRSPRGADRADMQIVFGANIDPAHADPSAPVRHAVAAEQLGYDFLTVQDHPYQRRHFDAWTLVTYLAARTERITVVPTVACLPLRPPAVLAKSVASLHLPVSYTHLRAHETRH